MPKLLECVLKNFEHRFCPRTVTPADSVRSLRRKSSFGERWYCLKHFRQRRSGGCGALSRFLPHGITPDLSAKRKGSKNEQVGKAEIGSEMPTEVNSLCPKVLSYIVLGHYLPESLLKALHSPYVLVETGLRLRHPEKSRNSKPVSD